MIDFVRKVFLSLLGQQREAGPSDESTNHVNISADAAVHVVHNDPFCGHVVLDDNDAVGSQASFAALQEVYEVVVCQMSCTKTTSVNKYATK